MGMVNVNFKIDKDVKMKFEELCNKLGGNMSVFINIFIKKTISENGIPFTILNNSEIERQKCIKRLQGFQEFNKKMDEIRDKLNQNISIDEINRIVKEYRKEKK